MLSPPRSWDSGLSRLGFRSLTGRDTQWVLVLQELKGGHCGAGCRWLVPDHLRGHCSGTVERSERLEPAAATKFLLAWHWKEGQAKWEAVPPPLPWPARAICRTPVGRWLTKETWNLCRPNPSITRQSAEEWVWSWETAVIYVGGTRHPNIEIAVQNPKPRLEQLLRGE